MPASRERIQHTGSAVTRVAKELLHRSTGHEYLAPFVPLGVGVAVRRLISERNAWKPSSRIQRGVIYGLAIGAGVLATPVLVAAGVATLPVIGAGLLGAAALATVETFAPEIVGTTAALATAPVYYGLATVDKIAEGGAHWLADRFRGRRGQAPTAK